MFYVYVVLLLERAIFLSVHSVFSNGGEPGERALRMPSFQSVSLLLI
jgi:hypothetical protein